MSVKIGSIFIEMNLKFKKLGIFIALALSILLCGCEGTRSYETFSARLDNTTWIPVYVLGQESTEIPQTSSENREAYIHFLHRGYGRFVISGRGGVNSFTGSMDVLHNGNVVFEPLASTMRIGKNHAYEACFVDAFKRANLVDFESDYMTLSTMQNGNKVLLAKFQKVAK